MLTCLQVISFKNSLLWDAVEQLGKVRWDVNQWKNPAILLSCYNYQPITKPLNVIAMKMDATITIASLRTSLGATLSLLLEL